MTQNATTDLSVSVPAPVAIGDILVGPGQPTYVIGEIGNTNAAVYTETLVIYAEDGDKAAAEDIKARIGYGRIIPSLERYSFEGNVLVIVGGDYQPL